MKSYLIKNKIDLIHIHNTFPLVELSLIEAAMSLNIPVVYSIHNYRFACINGLFFREASICTRCLQDDKQGVKLKCYKGSRWLSYLAANYRRQYLNYLKSASKILVLNNYAKNTLVSMGVDSSLIEMKRNFVSDYSEVFKPPTRDSRNILWVGRIDEAKGLRRLLANWLGSNLPALGYVLQIVGDGPLRAELEKTFGQTASIKFIGSINGSAINHYYQESKFLIVSSEWLEGFPMVIAEAAANGLMVIAPRLGAFLDLMEEPWVTLTHDSDLEWRSTLNGLPSYQDNHESAFVWFRNNATSLGVVNRLIDTYSSAISLKKK